MGGKSVRKGPPLELNLKAIFPFYVYYVDLKKYGRELGLERGPLELKIKAIFPLYVHYSDLDKYGRKIGLERGPP